MSTDYYSRLERERGPQPSEQMLASIAQGLQLSLDERDHLFRLGGHNPPARESTSEVVGPGILRIFERLDDTPAEIVTELGETLRQTSLGVALAGDHMAYVGFARSIGYRWFTDPTTRQIYASDDHPLLTRVFVSGLRRVVTLRGPRSRSAQLAELLLASSEEFVDVWNRHEVGIRPNHLKRFIHPELGLIELACQTLVDPEHSHSLLVYTAVPGSDSDDKLQQLARIGQQSPRPTTEFCRNWTIDRIRSRLSPHMAPAGIVRRASERRRPGRRNAFRWLPASVRQRGRGYPWTHASLFGPLFCRGQSNRNQTAP